MNPRAPPASAADPQVALRPSVWSVPCQRLNPLPIAIERCGRPDEELRWALGQRHRPPIDHPPLVVFCIFTATGACPVSRLTLSPTCTSPGCYIIPFQFAAFFPHPRCIFVPPFLCVAPAPGAFAVSRISLTPARAKTRLLVGPLPPPDRLRILLCMRAIPLL